MKKNTLQGTMAALGLLVLILDGTLALEGARAGIDLCIRTVIPALFPFFVLSGILTASLSGNLPRPVLFLADLLQIPPSAAPVLVPAILGGYPVGAKCVGDLHRQSRISTVQAQRLLAFSSNAGPSFLFGMVSGFFPEGKSIWLLWGIHLCSALLTARVFPPPEQQDSAELPTANPKGTDTILSSARAMVTVCCWVVLFRILIAFLESWFLWILPAWAQVLATGFLELTNGCCALYQVAEKNLRFVLCSCMLAWGGICVLLQTASVTNGLSLQNYIRGKLLQTLFSFLLSSAVVHKKGWMAACLILIFLIIFRKFENRYGNPGIVPV